MINAPSIAYYVRDPNDPKKFNREYALASIVDYRKIFANELRGLSY